MSDELKKPVQGDLAGCLYSGDKWLAIDGAYKGMIDRIRRLEYPEKHCGHGYPYCSEPNKSYCPLGCR